MFDITRFIVNIRSVLRLSQGYSRSSASLKNRRKACLECSSSYSLLKVVFWYCWFRYRWMEKNLRYFESHPPRSFGHICFTIFLNISAFQFCFSWLLSHGECALSKKNPWGLPGGVVRLGIDRYIIRMSSNTWIRKTKRQNNNLLIIGNFSRHLVKLRWFIFSTLKSSPIST